MARTAARFKQDDVTRVLKAAKALGLGARVNLVTGTIDILPKPIELAQPEASEPDYSKLDFKL